MAANLTEETTVTENKVKDEEESLPVVFQCKNCQTILGDSFSWVCADQNLQAVSLSAVTSSVAVEDGLETSTDGHDIGSTFIPLKCKVCNISIGRIYRTTPQELDIMRDVFTLDCSRIKSYQLGSQSGKNTYKTSEEILDIPTARNLQIEILKVQSIVVILNERLKSLESQLSDEGGEGQDDTRVQLSETNNNHDDTYYHGRVACGRVGKRPFINMDSKIVKPISENGPETKRKRVSGYDS